MIVPNFTVAEVRAYRELHQCSLMEAKEHFVKKQLLDLIAEVRVTGNIQILADVVEELINRR